MRILLLTTDIYGGYGGIAAYNRDLAEAVALMPECEELVVVPRIIPRPFEGALPDGVTFVDRAASSPAAYTAAIAALRSSKFDLVLCGHVHLLPVARMFVRDPVLFAYGIEAWRPRGVVASRLVRSARRIVAISEITRDRLLEWSGARVPASLLPNAIRAENFGIRTKRPDLVERYRLGGKRVLLTVGRIVEAERYKGFKEVIAVLPELPDDVVYLVAGGGNDMARLQREARRWGVESRLVLTGEFPEREKADLFALADAYVMPSRGEGFGFVFLEALASGLPVLGSRLDGGRDALLGGELGLLVDPTNPAEIVEGIEELLSRTERRIPERLAHFSFENFCARTAAIVRESVR